MLRHSEVLPKIYNVQVASKLDVNMCLLKLKFVRNAVELHTLARHIAFRRTVDMLSHRNRNSLVRRQLFPDVTKEHLELILSYRLDSNPKEVCLEQKFALHT